MAGVVHVRWYATVLRQHDLADALAAAAPIALRYDASRYAVHRSREDQYQITQMIWFEEKADWYRFWEGAEMIEFRRRHSGHYQVPITYIWHDELAYGELGPAVPEQSAPEPEPEPAPTAA